MEKWENILQVVERFQKCFGRRILSENLQQKLSFNENETNLIKVYFIAPEIEALGTIIELAVGTMLEIGCNSKELESGTRLELAGTSAKLNVEAKLELRCT